VRNQNNHLKDFFDMEPAPSPATPTVAPRYLTVVDIARRVHRHPNTVKDVASRLRLDLARTANGARLFTEEQAEKIAAEIERRRREALT
jgi:hypothetical protein